MCPICRTMTCQHCTAVGYVCASPQRCERFELTGPAVVPADRVLPTLLLQPGLGLAIVARKAGFDFYRTFCTRSRTRSERVQCKTSIQNVVPHCSRQGPNVSNKTTLLRPLWAHSGSTILSHFIIVPLMKTMPKDHSSLATIAWENVTKIQAAGSSTRLRCNHCSHEFVGGVTFWKKATG
jgi:hypothetical protein